MEQVFQFCLVLKIKHSDIINIIIVILTLKLNDNIVNMNIDIFLPLAPDPPTSTNRYLPSERAIGAITVETKRKIEFIVATSIPTLCLIPC